MKENVRGGGCLQTVVFANGHTDHAELVEKGHPVIVVAYEYVVFRIISSRQAKLESVCR
jgi:hypothetical protein